MTKLYTHHYTCLGQMLYVHVRLYVCIYQVQLLCTLHYTCLRQMSYVHVRYCCTVVCQMQLLCTLLVTLALSKGCTCMSGIVLSKIQLLCTLLVTLALSEGCTYMSGAIVMYTLHYTCLEHFCLF